MERAWFVSNEQSLREHAPPEGCARLYFGSEFCQLLAPHPLEVERALSATRVRGLGFTLVTPYLSEARFGEWLSLAYLVAKRAPSSEIVLNDWGLWLAVKEEKLSLRPVLGRLLARQKKGPEILRVKEEVPEEVLEHFASSGAAAPPFARFLQGEGFGRVEVDLTPLGLHSIFKGTGLQASLHTPWSYVATTRLCPVSGCEEPKRAGLVTIPEVCARECRRYTFQLEHELMPEPIVVKGNTQFYRSEALPTEEELARLGINRLVEAPVPPV